MANEDEEKLVEEMALSLYGYDPLDSSVETISQNLNRLKMLKMEAATMLSVVKLHPEVVAMVCSGCNGFGEIHDGDNCPDCHGSGVTRRKP